MSSESHENRSLKQDIKDEFCKRKFGFSSCHPQCMYKCQFWDVAVPLLIFRVIVALLGLAGSILLVVFNGQQASGSAVIFFTVWSFFLLTIYFIVSSVISLICVLTHKHAQRQQMMPNEGIGYSSTSTVDNSETLVQGKGAHDCPGIPLPWYMGLQWALYNIALSNAILVTLVYWAVLYPMLTTSSDYQTSFFDVSIHALNSVAIIAESYLNFIPIRLLHVIYPMIYGLTYAIFSGILYSVNGTVVYPYVLDWNRPGPTVGSIFGILFFYFVCQFILFLVVRLKFKCSCGR